MSEEQIDPGTVEPAALGLKFRNTTGVELAAGALVYCSGWNEVHRRDTVTLADANAGNKRAVWVVRQSVADGVNGRLFKQFRLIGVDTSTGTLGAAVYLSSTAGGWTLTDPQTADATAMSQRIGSVAVVGAGATDGEIDIDLEAHNAYIAGTGDIGSVATSSLTMLGQASTNLAVDDLVYVSSETAAGVPILAIADADADAKLATWVVVTAILSGATGTVKKVALSAATLNTNSFSAAGSPAYLTVTGTTGNTWTHTKPTGATARAFRAGRVVVKSATIGQIAWDLFSAEVEADGTTQLQDQAVTLAKVARQTDATFLMGKGAAADVVAQAMSGDVTVSSTGVATISPDITTKTNLITRETTTVGAKIDLFEGTNNGTNKVTIQGPASLAADRTLTFPDANVALADIATNTATAAAIVAENTDVVIPISTATFWSVLGTWTRTRTAAGTYRLRRTAGAFDDEQVEIEIPAERLRSTASKGLKITGMRVQYQVSVADAGDVTVNLGRTVMPATGAAVAAASGFGTVAYDTDHDSAAKRKAIGQHTLTATFSTPVYLADGFLYALIEVDSFGIATAQVDVYLVELLGSETLVDAA